MGIKPVQQLTCDCNVLLNLRRVLGVHCLRCELGLRSSCRSCFALSLLQEITLQPTHELLQLQGQLRD